LHSQGKVFKKLRQAQCIECTGPRVHIRSAPSISQATWNNISHAPWSTHSGPPGHSMEVSRTQRPSLFEGHPSDAQATYLSNAHHSNEHISSRSPIPDDRGCQLTDFIEDPVISQICYISTVESNGCPTPKCLPPLFHGTSHRGKIHTPHVTAHAVSQQQSTADPRDTISSNTYQHDVSASGAYLDNRHDGKYTTRNEQPETVSPPGHPPASGYTSIPAMTSSPRQGEHKQLHTIYSSVARSGKHNYQSARIPLPHDLHISVWRSYLNQYHDYVICDFLEFGWPMNYIANKPPTPSHTNHASACAYPADVDNYIKTEIGHRTLAGPYSEPPFMPWFQTSPLMTRPKKSSCSRRIIMDLSFPCGQSVNDGTPTETYLGEHYKLRLPAADDLVTAILQYGPGCVLYGTDIARAFRQLRCDPLDWPLLGICWNDFYYFDTGISFGSRWGSMACQRTTNAICHILSQQNQKCYAYIDDIIGVTSSHSQAKTEFTYLRSILSQLGIHEAVDKATHPNSVVTWIGIEFDTIHMQFRMPQVKITDTLTLLESWKHKRHTSKQQLQQLLGKLFHIAQCVKPARLFLGRMLMLLRSADKSLPVRLTDEFLKDISWFLKFLPSYNGIHMIRSAIPDFEVHVDSCLTGCGGHWDTHYYHTAFPSDTLQANHPICHLELLNILLALRLWGKMWHHKNVLVYCDNTPAVCVLTNGRSHDAFMMSCARHVWLIISTYSITLTARHKPGREMETADCLSRTHLHPRFQEKLNRLLHTNSTHRHLVHDNMFHLDSEI
jgi:hypothetical protein